MRMIGQARMNAQVRQKFGIRTDEIQAAIKKYNLKEDEQIKGYMNIVKTQLESEQKKEHEACSPSKEILEGLIKRVLEQGKPQYKQDGTMTFDYFTECVKASAEVVMAHIREPMKEQTAQRRQLLKEDKKVEYNECVQKTQKFEQTTSSIVDASLYQALKVPREVYEKTMKMYMGDQAKAGVIQQEIMEIKKKLDNREKRELTRDECVAAKKLVEKNKFEVQQKIFEIVKSQKLPPQLIHMLMKTEKMKQEDMFFNEMGFEEEDVEPSILRLGIKDDPELVAIREENDARSKKFLEERKVDTEKIQKQMAEMKAM